MKSNLTSQELEKIVLHVAKIYRKSNLRNTINKNYNVKENNLLYKQDKDFIHTIECLLGECSRDTRCIIENEFLKKTDSYWYLDFYTKSTFYRLKKKAVKEFIDCMDI